MPSLMRTTGVDFLEEYALAAERFAGAVAGAAPRAPVPTCPGWTVADLVRHLGNVSSWAATVVETGAPAARFDDDPRTHRPRRLAHWYLGKAEDLYRVLAEVDPEQPCWTFEERLGTAQFWLRRQLHETLMHAVDLAQANSATAHLPADLAADGIDEVFSVFVPRMHQRGHRADLVNPLAVQETDGGRAWTLLPGGVGAIPAQGVRRPVHDPQSPSGWPPVLQRGAFGGAGTTGSGAPVTGTPLRVTSFVEQRAPARPEAEAPLVPDSVDVLAGPAEVLLQVLWKRLPAEHPELRTYGSRTRIKRFLDSRLTA